MNPVLFLIILLLVIGGGYIAYKKKTDKDVQEGPTEAPTDSPILGVCNSGTENYDESGNFINCNCPPDAVGDRCQYTRKNSCNNGGNPVLDPETENISCQCDAGTDGIYCCDPNNPIYTGRNEHSDIATCTNKGWKITQKSCNELKPTYKNFTSLCNPGTNVANLRCNSYTDDNGNESAIVSCQNSKYEDPILQALYYPPDENNDPLTGPNKNLNNIFWEVLKTDRDLSVLFSPVNENDKQAARTQGNYGAFFKVYTFPDSSPNSNDIINSELKNAINAMFDRNEQVFTFDNFGNIVIKVNGKTKSFNNPAFPFKANNILNTETDKKRQYYQDCANKRYGIDPSDDKCWQYFPNADSTFSTYSPLKGASDLLLNNKNFITSLNKKWILYNNLSDPMYKVLYNPIHGSNFKKYFNTLPQGANDRVNDIIIQKYAEISAKKGTYGIGKSKRDYGDDSAHCFGGARSGRDRNVYFPDCVGYNVKGGKKYSVNPLTMEGDPIMNTLYTNLKGACACNGPSCYANEEIISNADGSYDSFLPDFQSDMRKYIYNDSKNANGSCPAKSINICVNDFTSAGDLKIEKSQVSANCG